MPDQRTFSPLMPSYRSLLADMLGLRFIAVMPRTTAREKIAAIEFHGGKPHLVDRGDVSGEA